MKKELTFEQKTENTFKSLIPIVNELYHLIARLELRIEKLEKVKK